MPVMRAPVELVSHQGRAGPLLPVAQASLHPTVGTLFEQTRALLQLWLYAMHLVD